MVKRRLVNRTCAFLLVGVLASSMVCAGYSKARSVKAFDFVLTPTIAYEVIATLLAACGITIGGIAFDQNRDKIEDAFFDYAENEYNLTRDKMANNGIAMDTFTDFIGKSYENGRVTVDDAVAGFIENLAYDFDYASVFGSTDFGVNVSDLDLPSFDMTTNSGLPYIENISIRSGINLFGCSLLLNELASYPAYEIVSTGVLRTSSNTYITVMIADTSSSDFHRNVRFYNDSRGIYGISYMGDAPTGTLSCDIKIDPSGVVSLYNKFHSSYSLTSFYGSNGHLSYSIYVNPAYSLRNWFGSDTLVLDDTTGFVDSDPLGMIKKKLEEMKKSLSDLSFGSVNDAGELTHDIPLVDPDVWADVADDVITWDKAIDDNKIVVWDSTTDIPVVGDLPDVIDPDKPIDPDPDNPDKPDNPDSPSFDKGGLVVNLSELFPFCIPFDLIRAVKVFNHEPEAPHVEWTLNIAPLNYSYTFVIDLESFNAVAAICRTMFLLLFIVGLIMATRGLIKG